MTKIEHMKMMQMPCLEIWSMPLSRQVLHKTNPNKLFWNELYQNKNTNSAGRSWGHTFFLKNSWNCFGFSLCLWKFLAKKHSTSRNLVKLCIYVTSLRKFKAKTQDPWEFHMNFSWSPMDIPGYFQLNSWKFCMLFLEYPWKFCILNHLPPCFVWFFSRIVQFWRPCVSSLSCKNENNLSPITRWLFP